MLLSVANLLAAKQCKVRETKSPSCFTVVYKQVGIGEINQIIESLQR